MEAKPLRAARLRGYLIAGPVALATVAIPFGCASAQSAPSRPPEPRTLPAAHDRPQASPARYDVARAALPDPAKGRPVSLPAILAYADRHAPALQVSRERLGLGDAAVSGAAPLLADNPSLSLGAGPRITADGTYTDLTASLSQRFEIAGERGLRREAGERTRDRLRAELEEKRWEVHQAVRAAFHRALVADRRLAVADRLLAFQKRLADITRRQLRAGDVSPLAVRLAEGELSQARVARIAAAQDHLAARLSLGALAGYPAAHPPTPAGELNEPRDPPGAAALAEVARRHQPRLRTLQAARAEAEAQARAAERDAWPEPALGVQVTREGAPSGQEQTIVLGSVSLPIPLFQRNQQARATARAEARIADAQRAAFSSQLGNRVEQARTAVVAAAARVRGYGHEILPTFEENLRLIERSFELGEIDILQVAVARERFLRIQTEALDAYGDYFQAVAELEAAIGTAVWPDERREGSPPAPPGAAP